MNSASDDTVVTIMKLILFKYLTIPLCLAVIVHGQHTPSITYISPTQTSDVGNQLELVCAVDHAEEYPVQWVKYDNLESKESLPLSYNSSLIVKDSRFSIRFNSARSAYLLSIKDLEESDAGWYQCQVLKAEDDFIKAEVELQIRRHPVFINNSTRSLVIVEGNSAQLECYASGYPAPNIYWRRENNAALPTGASLFRGNILNFESVKKEDSGTYYCVAENGVGKEIRRALDLHVEFAPIVSAIEPRINQALNTSVYLSCKVQAYPPPAITWFKEDVQLPFNQRYRISNFADSDDNVVTSLFLERIEKADYGNYSCKAKNKLGAAEDGIELYHSLISVCPPACEKESDADTTSAP